MREAGATPTVVKFYADGCPKCRAAEETYRDLGKLYYMVNTCPPSSSSTRMAVPSAEQLNRFTEICLSFIIWSYMPTVVKFYADGCPKCRAAEQTYRDLALGKFKGLVARCHSFCLFFVFYDIHTFI
jgi:thiol-disulfide isomerase/thioredoxin